MPNFTEKHFEDDIEQALLSCGGYSKGNVSTFNRVTALDEETLFAFVTESQPKAWEKYVKIYGDKSEHAFIQRFSDEVNHLGILHVLRHGFQDRGITLKVIFWKPETSLNEETIRQYNTNIFHCTRQLHYSKNNENSVDIVLFINGIPLVSMELKNQFTGQNTRNAIQQYRFDRSAKDLIFSFNKRVLVHFAVDLTHVFMTTKLKGEKTVFFPFNQGSNGAGNVGGAGNPQTENGYQTSYLWERVLAKDSLLEILQKYLHLNEPKDDKKTSKIVKMEDKSLIFPRYHQLDLVSKLLFDVKEDGSGKNYLIQHSAGSGKSNSIAWLAHRLSSLHNAQDNAIFSSVIIVTDRRVLDEQLQNTVYQFEHTSGVVKKVKKSAELRDAINDNIRIIVSTLQKFPVIFQEVNAKDKNFAIIIDEAHSSQTGSASKKLKYALVNKEKILSEYAQTEEQAEHNQEDMQDALLKELASHGTHENLSFFAFTATPKDKTLQAFGKQRADGQFYPFHTYSMKQAIEEGFIHDVLKNYMTYNMYFRIAKNIPDDPELDTSAGLKAIRQYQSLHPHNISQKTLVMIEHFNNITKHKIGGKAKAMLVTPSRLHAVRYFEEFKKQIKLKGLNFDVLVAFSGELKDPDTAEIFSEEKLNKNASGSTIKEKQLPSAFESDEFGMLIVAEKYQTGFDQPLLHTMFVDKALSGVKAVQTLSRLNRIAPNKEDTFILDFVNNEEDILKAFAPYYEETVLQEEIDPNIIYTMKSTLDAYQVYTKEDIEKFAKLYYSNTMANASSIIENAIGEYMELNDDDKNIFKTGLARFGRIYSFITHVCRMFDKDMHKFSIYAKYLLKFLPKDATEKIQVSDKVFLEYYKLEKDFEGQIPLAASQGEFGGIKGETGKKEKKRDPLTVLIDKINELFKTNFTEQDKVVMQIQSTLMKDESVTNFAKRSDEKTFMDFFENKFEQILLHLYKDNTDFFNLIFANDEARKLIKEHIGKIVYDNVNVKKSG